MAEQTSCLAPRSFQTVSDAPECSVMRRRVGGRSGSCLRSCATTAASLSSKGAWQVAQIAGRCSTTTSGVATSRSVSPAWPSGPPAF